jgi:23S rRNA (adenine1618-N6)-methyltransferase
MRSRKGKASEAPPPQLPVPKTGLHPRNRHRDRYDFGSLIQSCPELAPFVADNPYGDPSIDFADPEAVKTLNRALLVHFYGVHGWDIPPGYLCPPIPGRADYLHHLADLLAACNGGIIPRSTIRALDIGVGANGIYPLIGHREYGWRFLGSDIDPVALASAARILAANPGLGDAVQLRLQPSPERIFQGLLGEGETFDVCLCNPPFHASLQEAREGTQRKWRNLGRDTGARKPMLNFGGQGRELWCEGGEEAFVGRMIAESAKIPTRCLWFTTLVSKSSSLPGIRRALKQARVLESRTIEMAQGQKKSRIVAWTFLDPGQREAWRGERWR